MSSEALLAAALTIGVVLVTATATAPALRSPARQPSPPAGVRRRFAGRWSRRTGQRGEADDATVAAWCERVAAGVRSGSSLTQAVIDAADQPGSPFDHIVHAVRRGQPLATAFRNGPDDPRTAAGLTAPVVAACADVGGATAPALERMAEVLLARSAEHAERSTASAQARLSARVMTLVPVGVVGLLVVAEPSIRGILTTPAGVACVVTGTSLDLAGWWWMRRMIGAEP